jgi:hypothetical protein
MTIENKAAELCVKVAELEAQIEKAWGSFELDAEAFQAAVDSGLEREDAGTNPHARLSGLYAERRAAVAELREMRARW